MIYKRLDATEPIRQGDIFSGVPRIEASFDQLPVVNEQELVEEVSWRELLRSGQEDVVTALVSIRPVQAIVITQDCDTVRSPYISLCEICDFRQVEGRSKDTATPKSWMSIITQHARINLKWFYLPEDPDIGFTIKMGVDFRRVLRVDREQLESMVTDHRVARLNEVALPHFRERLAEFFRRYPYDEWYPLDKAELEAYQKVHPEIEIYPWQK